MRKAMKYEISTDHHPKRLPVICVKSDPSDPWQGYTTGHEIENGLLVCGVVSLTTGKEVQLKIKLEGKPELQVLAAELQRLQAEAEKAKVAREAKIAAIPGLGELRAAYAGRENKHYAYSQASEYGYPAKQAAAWRAAEKRAKELCGQYPTAAAYLLAESYAERSHWSNTEKAAAGRKALGRIIDGDDPALVISEMKDEWSAAARAAVDRA